jgi:hypothetical protein
MGQDIDSQCKPYCQDSPGHVDIHLFELQERSCEYHQHYIYPIRMVLLGTQRLYGSPFVPGGHLHFAL